VGLSVFLTALAVKTLDDLLDEPEETALSVGAAKAAAYSALLLALGAGIAPARAVSLFLAAYAAGMLPAAAERLPTGVPSWAESAAAALLAAVLTGPLEAAGSLLVMMAVQAADDVCDAERDRAQGRPNLTRAAGRAGAVALAAVSCVLALVLAPEKTLAVLAVALPVVTGWAGGDVLRSAFRSGSHVSRGRARLRLAAVGLAAAGAAVLGRAVAPALGLPPAVLEAGGGAPALPGTWVVWVAACVAGAVALAGVPAAYRRGLQAGRRREREGAKALARLARRAEELEGAAGGSGTPGTGERPGAPRAGRPAGGRRGG